MSRGLAAALMVAGTSLAAGCSIVTPSELVPFIIRVDSVTTVGTVSRSAPLQLRFWGPIGNSCDGFREIVATRNGATLEVTVMGQHLTNATCADVLVSLGPDAVYVVNPPIQDPFTVRVRRPDGTALVLDLTIEGSGTVNRRN